MGTSTGRLGDPVAGCPGQKRWEVLAMFGGRRSYIFFQIQLKRIKLTLTQEFIVNGNSKKFSKQYNG